MRPIDTEEADQQLHPLTVHVEPVGQAGATLPIILTVAGTAVLPTPIPMQPLSPQPAQPKASLRAILEEKQVVGNHCACSEVLKSCLQVAAKFYGGTVASLNQSNFSSHFGELTERLDVLYGTFPFINLGWKTSILGTLVGLICAQNTRNSWSSVG